MIDGFDLEVIFAFDREQSYIELKLRVEKENATTSSSTYQQMNVKFYADSVGNPHSWKCTKVDNPDDLPPGLKAMPKALNFLNRGELWVLDLEYLNEHVVAEGIEDGL